MTVEGLMTVEELVEKYGDVVLDFSSYYKYEFSYRGIAPDGKEICIRLGGNSDDIYSLMLSDEETVSNLIAEDEYLYFSVETPRKK